MITLPVTENPIVLRTDFDNEACWQKIMALISEPQDEEEFMAYVNFVSDKRMENISVEELSSASVYPHLFLFVVDKYAMEHPEHALLCVSLGEERGRSFRLTPAQVQCVENNLSIANMDFADFADSADGDGVFRGF